MNWVCHTCYFCFLFAEQFFPPKKKKSVYLSFIRRLLLLALRWTQFWSFAILVPSAPTPRRGAHVKGRSCSVSDPAFSKGLSAWKFYYVRGAGRQEHNSSNDFWNVLIEIRCGYVKRASSLLIHALITWIYLPVPCVFSNFWWGVFYWFFFKKIISGWVRGRYIDGGLSFHHCRKTICIVV